MRGPTRIELPERVAAGAVIALLAVLVVAPVLRLAHTALDPGGESLLGTLTDPGLGSAIAGSLLLATSVTVIAVPLGAAIAFALHRRDIPAGRLWRVAALLPVLVPDFVLGYSWTQAYGRAGFTDSLLGFHWPGLLGPGGITVVLVVNAVPIVYLLTAAGLAVRSETDLVQAARVCGAGPLTALRTVTLPLLRPALAAAAVLTFVTALQSFAIPQILGTPAGFRTLTTRIYSALALASDPEAFTEAVTTALVLVALAMLVIGPADVLLGPRLRVQRLAQPAGGSEPALASGVGVVVATGLGAYFLLTIALPLLALVAASVTPAAGVPPTPEHWTLDNFAAVLDEATAMALGRSASVSAVAATLLVVLGGLVAVLERRRGMRGLGTVVTLTFVLPGSTLAVALLTTYGQWIGGTLTLILLAYLTKLWAFAHRPISGGLDRLPPAELQAARVSGAGLLAAVRTVALRPLLPVLVGGWLLVFTTGLHEITMSSLLYGPGTETIAVVVLNTQELGMVGKTSALSVFLGLILLLPALLLWLVLRRSGSGRAATTATPRTRLLEVSRVD